MAEWIIYHNPRCGKSRQTLELLRKNRIEPLVVEYLKSPPTASQLQAMLKKLGMKAGELLRRKEPAWRELGLDPGDEAAVIRAMTEHPILIERPVVVKGDKAVLGRPPENVLKLL